MNLYVLHSCQVLKLCSLFTCIKLCAAAVKSHMSACKVEPRCGAVLACSIPLGHGVLRFELSRKITGWCEENVRLRRRNRVIVFFLS